jgi:hypothetical protein
MIQLKRSAEPLATLQLTSPSIAWRASTANLMSLWIRPPKRAAHALPIALLASMTQAVRQQFVQLAPPVEYWTHRWSSAGQAVPIPKSSTGRPLVAKIANLVLFSMKRPCSVKLVPRIALDATRIRQAVTLSAIAANQAGFLTLEKGSVDLRVLHGRPTIGRPSLAENVLHTKKRTILLRNVNHASLAALIASELFATNATPRQSLMSELSSASSLAMRQPSSTMTLWLAKSVRRVATMIVPGATANLARQRSAQIVLRLLWSQRRAPSARMAITLTLKVSAKKIAREIATSILLHRLVYLARLTSTFQLERRAVRAALILAAHARLVELLSPVFSVLKAIS